MTANLPIAALLLTGGRSRRMGFDKGRLAVDGEPLAARLATMLRVLAHPALEVGPGWSGLPALVEEQAGAGPLVALAAGARALRALDHRGPTLVVACDLPLLDGVMLRALARWPASASVVPVVGGHTQPLCARWSADDLDAAVTLAAAGERSMRSLLARPGVTLLRDTDWPPGVDPGALADADTPAELDRLGVGWSLAPHPGEGR